jgi:PRTRC genetic system protein C
MPRQFVYDGRTFPDPDPALSVEDVRRQLADYFPELANADTRENRTGDDTVYTFSRRIGTKGASRRLRLAPDIVSILRGVPARDLRVFEIAAELLLPDGTLDIDAAAAREPEIALAAAEADAYSKANRRVVNRLTEHEKH